MGFNESLFSRSDSRGICEEAGRRKKENLKKLEGREHGEAQWRKQEKVESR